MVNEKKQNSIVMILFLGMLISLFAISGFWGIGKYRSSDGCRILFFFIGAAISALLFYWKSATAKQWSIIHGLMALFWVNALICNETDKSQFSAVVMGSLFLAIGVGLNAASLYRMRIWEVIKQWLFEHWQLLILMALFVLLSLETLTSTPRGDSNTYFRMGFLYAVPKFDFTLRNLSSFYLADHVAPGYAFLGLIGVFLDTKDAIGLRIVDIILILASVYAFYELLGMLVKRAGKVEKVLATAVYAFHPLILGMIASVSLDKPTLALMVLMVYFYFSEQRLLAAFAGMLFLTTKEPNIAFYGAFMAAVYIVRFFGYRGAGIGKRIRETFFRVQFLADIIPPLIMAYLVLFGSSWASSNMVIGGIAPINYFGIVERNTLSKNLQLGILNFNWLLLLGTAFFLIIFILQYGIKNLFKNRKFWDYVVPLGVMQLAFVGFQYVYYTYPNARYITPYEFVLSFGFALLVLAVRMGTVLKRFGVAVVAFLMLTQSMITVDPLTIKKLATLNAGSVPVCSTEEGGKFHFNQTMEYNRQYTYWDGVIRTFLSDIQIDENVYVGYPFVEGANFFAQFFPHWNADREMFEYAVIGDEKYVSYPVEGCVGLNWGEVSERALPGIKEADYENVYLLVPEMYAEQEDVMNTLSKVDVLETKVYSYRGWKITVYRVEVL